MRVDILFETNRFNLSETKTYFINECCFGEDLADWLRQKLILDGFVVSTPEQEDWGWFIETTRPPNNYFIGIGGTKDELSQNINQGEWRIMIEKKRSFFDKILGKNKLKNDDAFVCRIFQILQKENDLLNIHKENS